MGRRHAGTNVLILVHYLHIRIVTTDGELLRELQLDPTKDYEPQTKPRTMSQDTCARCPETSQWWAKGDLNPHVPKDTGT